jgi:mono/diheme cytochrome c family protein
MSRSGALLPVVLGVIAAAAASAAEQAPGTAHGKQVFDKWCAPCHAPGTAFPGTRALDAKYDGKIPAALEQRTDLSADLVRSMVRHGVSIMPFFRKTEISDADLADLAAYLTDASRQR